MVKEFAELKRSYDAAIDKLSKHLEKQEELSYKLNEICLDLP
jgi:hypothetical protein